MKKVDKGDRGR